MRLLLLGDRMLVEGITEALSVDDTRVVVVCPNGNDDYRRLVFTTPHGRRFPQGITVLDAMRKGLKDPRRLNVVAQEELVAALRSGPLAGELKLGSPTTPSVMADSRARIGRVVGQVPRPEPMVLYSLKQSLEISVDRVSEQYALDRSSAADAWAACGASIIGRRPETPRSIFCTLRRRSSF